MNEKRTRISSIEKEVFKKVCDVMELNTISRYGTVNFNSSRRGYDSTLEMNLFGLGVHLAYEEEEDEKFHRRISRYLKKWETLNVMDDNLSVDFYNMPEKYRKIVPIKIADKLEDIYYHKYGVYGKDNPNTNKSSVRHFSWIRYCDTGLDLGYSPEDTIRFFIGEEIRNRIDITDRFIDFLQRFCEKEYNSPLEEIIDACDGFKI